MDRPTAPSLRLRIFAGPNGSGKSTIIKSIQNYRNGEDKINFGYYINADDIAQLLATTSFDFRQYGLHIKPKRFGEIALASGLIGDGFTADIFINSFDIKGGILRLKDNSAVDRLAQITAEVLRHELIHHKIRFSFETVFSHRSKLAVMRKALEVGYKIYLYFVATEDPAINEFRVKARVAQGGHPVPVSKIALRYTRSLDLLYEASLLAYRAYFFDNSEDGINFKMFADFKVVNKKRVWSKADEKNYPEWFKKYYLSKMNTESEKSPE